MRFKENIEGQDLSGYLIDLFSSCVGSECDVELNVSAAYSLGPYRPTNKYPRDIIVKFPFGNTKAKVLETRTFS